MCSIKYNLNALFLEHNKQFEHNAEIDFLLELSLVSDRTESFFSRVRTSQGAF